MQEASEGKAHKGDAERWHNIALRNALLSSLPAGLLGLLFALFHLAAVSNQPQPSAVQGQVIYFASLALLQILLGLLHKRAEQSPSPRFLHIALLFSALASALLWGEGLTSTLQLGEQASQRLILPLLALFIYGLHFALAGFSLLLFYGGLALIVSSASFNPLPPLTVQSLLLLGGLLIVISQLGLWLLHRRLCRSRADREVLQDRLAALEMRSEHLQSEVQHFEQTASRLKEDLAEARQAAQVADLKKNEFMATMSHEIRTPLNGILPLLEMLGETGLNKEQKKLVNTAHNSSRHLLRIINDILDFSKIEAGKLELEQVELSIKELIEGVTSLMSNMAAKRNLEIVNKISTNTPPRLRGDPLRLRQILSNLVSNAVKFTERGSITIEVNTTRDNKRDVEVVFSVRDTGVGMDSATISRLFSSFTQADASTTRKYGGTGLGLVICKRLVNLMGGQIGVRSKLGSGSVFWFMIPMRRPLDEIPAGRESLQGARLLLAGFGNRDFEEISQLLQRWEVIFSRVDDTPSALSALGSAAMLGGSWMHDLLMFDFGYLGNSTRDLMSRIKGSQRLSRTATLAVIQRQEEAEGLMKLGVNDTLLRPVREAQLNQILCRLLDVRDDDYRESELLEKGEIVVPMLERDILYDEEDSRLQASDTPPPAAARPVETSAVHKGKNGPSISGSSILLVEDNDVNRLVARRLLEKLGMKVSEATDGAEALKKVDANRFDLVLMDCRMPNMDGYEATGAIRDRQQNGQLGPLPVIAMTANAMAGDREKCIEAGMDDYLTKPVNQGTLSEMLSKWLKPVENSVPEEAVAATTPSEGKAKMGIGSEIDLNIINELKGIMEDDFVSLLESYINNVTPLYKELHAAAVSDNVAGMVNPAHSIKSSSANIGAMKVSAAAKTIEMAARNNDGATAKKAFQTLNQVLPPAVKELNAIIAGSR